MAFSQVGPRRHRNVLTLAFITGTDTLATKSTWTDDGGNTVSIEDDSDAYELAADGLSVVKVWKRLQGKWALIATLN